MESPRPGAGPRRVWSDSKGILWVSLWNAGEVGRYDPAAKAWKTWPINDAKHGSYLVYVDDKDKVWLTDFSTNAILRLIRRRKIRAIPERPESRIGAPDAGPAG